MGKSFEEAQIGERIRLVRSEDGVSRPLAARQMGLTPDQLKRIESGEVAVRFFPAILFCQFADINPLWLAFGEPEKRFGFFGVKFTIAVEKTFKPRFLEVMERNKERYRAASGSYTYDRERDADAKKQVGTLSIKRYLIPEMIVETPPSWNELRTILVAKTESAKAKVELARRLGVTMAAISQWRSGASAPTADNALRILEWIRETEAEQKQSAGSVSESRPTPKPLTRKSKHEKPSPNRKKH
jgi:transcriptional regulator with XRE-family HTH domain